MTRREERKDAKHEGSRWAQSFEARRDIVVLICAGAVVSIGLSVAASAQLPDGRGKDTFARICSGCHNVDKATALRLTRSGWDQLITDMVQNGADMSDDDRKSILDYLATNFLGEAEKPLNVNGAKQIDLELVGGLLRKEAAALLAYLAKTGPCQDLADLKKVPGLDYKKIEARKDVLVCGTPPIKKDATRVRPAPSYGSSLTPARRP